MKRTYVYKHRSRTGHYTADAFVIRCFDNRFWKSFKHFMKRLGLRDIDPESVAGGPKVLASPEKSGDRDFLLREFEKSIRLHGVKKVMLFSHSDCGAYGGVKRFAGDKDKEFAFHCVELKKARGVLRKRFPRLRITAYFVDNEGIIKI